MDDKKSTYKELLKRAEQETYDRIDVQEYLADPQIRECFENILRIFSSYSGDMTVKKLHEYSQNYLCDIEHYMVFNNALNLCFKLLNEGKNIGKYGY